MADQLSIEEFAAKIKERRPDLANIPNDVLVGKTLGAAPELKEFVNLDTTMPAPEGIISSLFGHLGVQRQDPAGPSPIANPLQPSVTSEGAAQSLTGMGKALIGLPGAIMSMLPTGENNARMIQALMGAGSAAAHPVQTVQQANLGNPEAPAWQGLQQAAGANLVASELPNAIEGAITSPMAKALMGAIPSADRAGANLNTIRQAAANVPVDLTDANTIIGRAEQLRDTGHGPLSAGMRKMVAAQQPQVGSFAGTQVTMAPDPILYPESFDFASAAKKLASRERQAQTGMMQGQVKQFAGALQDANRAAADQVGMGPLFDSAMKEYSQAKTLENAVKIAKKYAVRAAIGGALYGGYRELTK